MNYPKDLCTLVVDFFKPRQKNTHNHRTNNINSDTYNNGDDNVIVVNDEDINSKNSTFTTPTSMVNIVRTHMIYSQEIKSCGEENNYRNEEDDKK